MPPLQSVEIRRRSAGFVAATAALLLGAFLLRYVDVVSGPVEHTVAETVATVAAFAVGALALVRYHSRRDDLILLVGAGFLGAAFLDGYHGLVTSPPFLAAGGVALESVSPWSWFTSRFFLSVFLLLSVLAWLREQRGGEAQVAESAVYRAVAVLASASFLLFVLVPLPRAIHADLPVHRPQELLAGLFFLAALVLYVRDGGWRRNAFAYWFALALLLSAASQLLYMPFSATLFDAWFDAAHGVKILSYLAVATGLLKSVYHTYRMLEENTEVLAETNRRLEVEVGVREEAEAQAKRAQRDLEIEKTYLERLFEHAPEAIVLMDGAESVTRINTEFTRLFGYTRAQAAGRTINELIVPDEERANASELTRQVTGGRTVSMETVRRRRDGTLVDVSVLGTPMRLVDGLQAVYGIYRDIGERKRTQEQLRDTVEKLQALVLASPLAILTLDLEGRVGLWNPAAGSIFGWGEEEVVGGPVPFVLPGDEATFRRLFGHALAGVPSADVEAVLQRRDGTDVQISVSSAPLCRADGAVTGLMAVANDVTDRKRAEAALALAKAQAEEANRSKSEFLARMSHELRTPLNSVIGFTKVLLKNRQGNLTEGDTNFLGRIAANGEHLLELINDILDLSKIEAGRMELEMGPVELGELVQETAAQLEGRVLSHEVALLTEIPPRLAPLQADRHKLKQILINLVGNALKFTEHGQVTVRVCTEAASDRPRALEVSDTGIGIPPERLTSIFEAFEQAEQSTTRKYGGTGLGLSISSRLTELMGYRLEVRSEMGRGSTFSIVFEPQVAAGDEPVSDAPAGAPDDRERAAGAE